MPTSVRLPQDLEKRLTILAETTGRSKAFYIREAIQEYLDDLEDIYMAREVLERVRKGEEEIYTLDEVERDHIRRTLDLCGGNQTRAAKRLGISRNTLLRKLDKYGVPRPRKKKLLATSSFPFSISLGKIRWKPLPKLAATVFRLKW